MRVQRLLALTALLLACAWLLPAQGLGTNATKDDWEEVNFEFNSSILSDGYPSLLRLAELLQQHKDFKVRLEGNADRIGSHRYNDKLSQKRAETVKAFLVKYGASEGQISVVAKGKRDPKVSNDTMEGRFMNRRVSMVVTDGQGKVVSAGGVGDAIKAMQAQPARERMCCEEILKRLDKLDDILAAIRDLKAENDKLKQDVAALQKGQGAVEKQVAELPKGPDKAEMQKMMDDTADRAVEKAKPNRFSILALNIGPTLNSSLRPGFDRDIKMAGAGNASVTGRGRYFAPFGKDESHALQAEGEYNYYHDRQEGQFDVGLVNRWSNVQFGLFNSMKHVHISDLGGGGTLGQGAATFDVLFKYGRFGVFGTKGYLNNRVIARTPVLLASGATVFNMVDEHYLRIVDQVGASASVGLWKDAYLDANFGALFRRGGQNRPGGMFRVVQPINRMWAFTVEAGVNEGFVGPNNTGRIAVGVQLGNWMRPKEYAQAKSPVPADIPRLRYELLTRRVRTGNASPVADAGPDQIGVSAGTITLDGSASYDPDGDPITFAWTQTGGPAVSLSAPTAAQTTFTAAEGQTYNFRLVVKDSLGAQGTAKVAVTTAAAAQVRILQFTATPNAITAGQSSTLAWQVENAESVEISGGVGSVNPSSGSTPVTPAQTTTYTLTAHGQGKTATATAVVSVSAGPVNPLPIVVTFSANPASIAAGQSSTLAWQTQNAETVTISGLGEVALNGSSAVSPAQTTTYTLTATNSAGQVTATVTVTVGGSSGLPVIVGFNANPSQINVGGQSTLAWQVLNATQVTISGGVGNVALTGSQGVSPSATTTYTLTATNANGQASATATVTVVDNTPRILSFTANPSTINQGSSSRLTWTTQNATSAVIVGVGPVSPNGSADVTPPATKTYTLTITGSNGAQVSQDVTVTVIPPTEPEKKPPVISNSGAILYTTSPQVVIGLGVSDPQGLPLTYAWSAVSPGAAVINPTAVNPIVTLPVMNGTYTFSLTVTNSAGLSTTGTVQVTLTLQPYPGF